MALSATITNGVLAQPYKLLVENWQLYIEKSPIAQPLPGINPLLLDLGQFLPRIILQGTVDDISSTEGVNTIPSKNDLEDFCIDAGINNYTVTVTMTYASTVGGAAKTDDVYIGKILSFRPDRRAPNVLWDFTLILACQRRTNLP